MPVELIFWIFWSEVEFDGSRLFSLFLVSVREFVHLYVLGHYDITEPRLVLSQKIVAKKEGCGPPEGSSIMPVPGST